MPSLIISVQEGGAVLVAAIEPTPDMLADAEQFASIEEATQAAVQVLTPEGAEQPEAGAAPTDPATATPDPTAQGGEGMDALLEGFTRAKRGQ